MSQIVNNFDIDNFFFLKNNYDLRINIKTQQVTTRKPKYEPEDNQYNFGVVYNFFTPEKVMLSLNRNYFFLDKYQFIGALSLLRDYNEHHFEKLKIEPDMEFVKKYIKNNTIVYPFLMHHFSIEEKKELEKNFNIDEFLRLKPVDQSVVDLLTSSSWVSDGMINKIQDVLFDFVMEN